jgi:hypothetical protein
MYLNAFNKKNCYNGTMESGIFFMY